MKTSPQSLTSYLSGASKALCFSVLGMFAPGFAQGATVIWIDNDISWGGPNSAYWRFGDYATSPTVYDGLPNNVSQTTPVWTQAGSSGSVTPGPNYLNITTEGTNRREFQNSTAWDASVAATVEFTVRLNSGSTAILAGNTSEWLQITLGIDGGSGDLTIGGTRINDVLASSFNTIRLTLSGMDSPSTSAVSVYVNNSVTAALTYTNLSAGSITQLRFGDTSTTSGVLSQSSDWQSFKWLSGQAIAPIPEPASVALLLGGGLLLLAKGRRRL